MLRRPRFADVDDFVMLQMTGMLVRQCSAGTGRKRGMLILNKDSDVLIESGFCDIIDVFDNPVEKFRSSLFKGLQVPRTASLVAVRSSSAKRNLGRNSLDTEKVPLFASFSPR